MFMQFGNTLLQDKIMVGFSKDLLRAHHPAKRGDLREIASQGQSHREMALLETPRNFCGAERLGLGPGDK